MTDWNKLLGPTSRHLEKNREKEKEFRRKIRDFVTTDTVNSEWKSALILNNIQQSSRLAVNGFNRQLMYILAIWLSTYLIGHGFISEGTLFAMRTTNIYKLLIFGPPLLGFTIYRLCVSHVSSDNIGKTYREVFSNIYPKGHEIGILSYIEPKTAFGYEFESIMQSNITWDSSSIKNLIKKVFLPFLVTVVGLMLLPFVSFIHVCIIPFYFNSWYVCVASVLIGLIFFYRGLQILAISADLPQTPSAGASQGDNP